MIGKIRRTYGTFTASYDYRTVSKFVRNTSRAFTLEYCAKTAVYGAILEQNARLRPIYGSLRRSVMIDLGKNEKVIRSNSHHHGLFSASIERGDSCFISTGKKQKQDKPHCQ